MLKVKRYVLLFPFNSTDRDLGLESPLLSSKPQSHPLGTSGKAEADDLSVAERRFAQEQHAEGVNDQITSPDPHVPVSEERWALDALRNCKFDS